MVLVPLAYVYFNSQKTKKYLISILILLYMVVNLLIFGNLYNNNKVISEIVLYLNNNKILVKLILVILDNMLLIILQNFIIIN